jgi:hypothetical protein
MKSDANMKVLLEAAPPRSPWRKRGCAAVIPVVLSLVFVLGSGCNSRPSPGGRRDSFAISNGICDPDVLTQGYGPERTNAQTCETVLTNATVNSSQFGKLYSRYVDGRIFAQPLFVTNVSIAGKPCSPSCNVIYVATAANNLYAFDSSNGTTDPYGALLWQRNLGRPASVEDLAAFDAGLCKGTVYPYSGVVGTPVIDKDNNAMYIVAEIENSPSSYDFVVHAIDIRTGADITGVGPTSVPHAINGVTFSPDLQLQRAGLLLQNNAVYAAFASACGGDIWEPTRQYHGWLLRFRTSNLAFLDGFSLGTPPASGGGIWQSGTGVVGKTSNGVAYVMSGNGKDSMGNNATVPGGDSFLKVTANSMTPVWYQQPNDSVLAAADIDLMGGPMLLPSGLLVGAGKQGIIYAFDTTNASSDVGGSIAPRSFQASQCNYPSSSCSPYCAVGSTNHELLPHIHSRAYWNGNIYVWGHKDVIRSFNSTTFAPTGSGTTISPYDPTFPFSDNQGCNCSFNWSHPPPVLAISASGTSNGIIWAYLARGPYGGASYQNHSACPGWGAFSRPYAAPARLVALDPGNNFHELWNSDMLAQDALPSHPRFAIPTIASGRVYAPTFSDELTVYGLKTATTTGFPVNTQISAVSRTPGRIDAFAIGNDGTMYSAFYNGSSWTKFSRLLISAQPTPSAPPGAPIAAISRDPDHIDLFYIDNLGELQTVWWDSTSGSYHVNVLNSAQTEVANGGRGTAPPGTPVAAIGNSQAIHVALVDYYGAVEHFRWSSSDGWHAADWVFGLGTGTALLRTPVTVVWHSPQSGIELYLLNRDGTVWNSWCGSHAPDCPNLSDWHPAQFASAPVFPARTPVAAFSRDSNHEDVMAVDAAGQVWRAFWDGTGWSHSGYTPFGPFSSAGMLPQRAFLGVNARDANDGNLLAADGSGKMLSEWFAGSGPTWQYPVSTGWSGTISSAWQAFIGAGTVTPGSSIVMIGNVPSAGNLDLLWVDAFGSIWDRHWGGSWGAASKLYP